MVWDDDFQPKLGKMRSSRGKAGRKYLHRALQAAALAGGIARPGSHPRRTKFHGSQIGRGAGIGRVLSERDRYGAFRSRRVIVKSRIVKLAGRGLQAARAHLRYIQRDGVTREGQPGQLYSAAQDRTDGRAFIDRAEGDRHQFRFIVAPEDGAEYDDLKSLTRRLMAQVEQDLGSKLDWVAVDHYNTGHPHTHIILCGKDDQGQDLVIARDYISKGLRERAAELVSLDLGPRSDIEIENRLRQEIEQERLTSIDRRLVRDLDKERQITTVDRDPFQQTLRAGRLQKLKRLGLAEEVAPSQWRIAPDLEPILRRMGERGDIIRTMQRDFAEKGLTRAAGDYAIFEPGASGAQQITGRVVARGLSDEINDRQYLIVDGVDGRSYYVEIGQGAATDPISEGSIVRIEPKRTEPRPVDRIVAEIATAHDGVYSIDIHLGHDPSATAAFAQTHVRRLEAMRRLTGGARREADGTWKIGLDHLVRAAAFEREQALPAPVVVRTVSTLPLHRQLDAGGATWLDRELVTDKPVPLRDAGFGREVRQAQSQRRQWLLAEGLAREEESRIVYGANMLATLRRREITYVAGKLSREMGLSYAETNPGGRVEGIYRRHVDLASGRFAIIEKSREFTMVPWRPILEHHLDRQVTGIWKGDSTNWTFGRQRNGPSVS